MINFEYPVPQILMMREICLEMGVEPSRIYLGEYEFNRLCMETLLLPHADDWYLMGMKIEFVDDEFMIWME